MEDNNNNNNNTNVIYNNDFPRDFHPFPGDFSLYNSSYMRLIRRMMTYGEPYNLPEADDFVDRFEVYSQFESNNFERVYDMVWSYLLRSK